MEPTEINGKQIKAAATLAGISLTELADKLGLSRSTLYAYVSGVLQPPRKRLRQIAALTETPIEFFLSKDAGREAAEDALKLADALLSGANPSAASALIESRLESIADEHRAALMLKLANSLVLEGQYQEGLDWCIRARELFDSQGDTHSAGRCSQTLGFCYANIGPLHRAQACFEDAQSRLNPDSKWRARVALAVVAERHGDFSTALEMLDALESSLTDPALTLYSLGIRADILSNMGRWPKVLELEIKALQLAEELDSRDQIGERLISLIIASVYTGQSDTDAHVAQALGFFQAHTDKARKAYFLIAQSLYWQQKGEASKAFQAAEQALESAIKGRFRRTELAAYLRLAEIAFTSERLPEALSYARQAAAYSESYEYAGEHDYAQALVAYFAAKNQDRMLALQRIRSLDARSVWKEIPTIAELVDGARAITAGEPWSDDDVAKRLSSKGLLFVPVFPAKNLMDTRSGGVSTTVKEL
ncbi:MAG: helix-turn-helix transcriptional regulator [Fimbriimonadaceae bacterium]|nr:helix-turn-helix transcriptional regulator [Fimbriimonadaceae bacterium]